MVSTNLNPGRKVLKVKPAENCIIRVSCLVRREDILLLLTFLAQRLPAQPVAAGRGVGRGATGSVYSFQLPLAPSLTLSILSSLNAFPTKVPGAPCL